MVVMWFSFSDVVISIVLFHAEVNFDYSVGYQELYGEGIDQVFQPELNPGVIYYYGDGTGVQMYSVDEALLKEYIKHQM